MIKSDLELIPNDTDVVRERFADIAHESWAGWMKFLFHVSEQREDGSVVISAGRVARWQRQINTPYEALSADEQEAELLEADKYLAVVQPMLEQTAAWEQAHKAMLAGVEGETVGEKINETLNVLMDVVYQACYSERDDVLDTNAIGPYKDGVELLAGCGRLTIKQAAGRRLIAEMVDV